MARVLSDLNLNGRTSSRVQPKVGDWGPQQVPSTRFKKVNRALAYVALLLGIAVVVTVAVLLFYFGGMKS